MYRKLALGPKKNNLRLLFVIYRYNSMYIQCYLSLLTFELLNTRPRLKLFSFYFSMKMCNVLFIFFRRSDGNLRAVDEPRCSIAYRSYYLGFFFT